MQQLSSHPRSADAFGFVDADLQHADSGSETRRLLLDAVADQLRLIDVPMIRLRASDRWPVQVGILSRAEAVRAVEARVRLARRHGVDASTIFEINEAKLHGLAQSLSSLLYETRGRRLSKVVSDSLAGTDTAPPPICTILGHEDLIRLIGLPSEQVVDLEKWFRKALLRHSRQMADYFAHCMQKIGRDSSPIVSGPVLASRARQLERQANFAATHCFTSIDESGQQQSIDFSDAANSAHRRASKTYARLKGLDTFCTRRGLAGFFVTLTLPSAFHPNPSSGRRSWSGATPREGHDELQSRWRQFQRRFGESGGKVYGVRVEEPHNDGCPHWHLLMYIDSNREQVFRTRISEIFGSGPAAEVVAIDRTKGSGATYLMKYIRPVYKADVHGNQGAAEGEASCGESKTTKTALYDAFRATWGGRCIQFFDVPGSSTSWDEFRRIKLHSEQYAKLSAHGVRLHDAANTTDYAEFLMLLAEAREEGASGRIQVLYGRRETGTRFVEGIHVDGANIETHLRRWTVTRKNAGEGR